MGEYIFRNNSNIGNLEAETDLFLQDCFIETEGYKIFSLLLGVLMGIN